MARLPAWIRQHLAALRVLVVLTALVGVGYPLALTAIAQLPGLQGNADGSLVTDGKGQVVGSRQIGQAFTDGTGTALPAYFQSRPSAATANVPIGYDPTATSASNLGPENVVDTLPNLTVPGDTGKQSLLTQVCARSVAAGRLEGVDGARPYCTASGVGAVLAVFYAQPGYIGAVRRVVSVNQACPTKPFLATYQGVAVQCARYGQDYRAGKQVLIRGEAPAHPAVPADAVTASGSGLDPDISVAYARLQAARIARARRVPTDRVLALVGTHTTGRALGFLGEPAVNVVDLNVDLDRRYPAG